MADMADPNPFDSAEEQTLQLEAVEPQSFDHLELTLPASPSLQAQPPSQQQLQQQAARKQPSHHTHHAHHHPHHPHVTAAMYISSHGAAAVQGLDLDDCDDDNPFDSPRLPAHSRPHLLDVAPVDGGASSVSDAICAADEAEVVPHWKKEYKTLLALAIPSVLVNLTSVMITIISQALVGRLSVESLAAAVCSTMYFNLLWMGVYGCESHTHARMRAHAGLALAPLFITALSSPAAHCSYFAARCAALPSASLCPHPASGSPAHSTRSRRRASVPAAWRA